ncbi:MAG: ABC transporter permease, partial [Chloroflexota bacterium]
MSISIWRTLLLIIPTNNIPLAAVYGALVHTSGSPVIVTYVAFGLFFLSIWNAGVIDVGDSLPNEVWAGTMDAALVSRSSLLVIMLGHASGYISRAVIRGIPAFATVLLVGGTWPHVQNIPVLLVSLVVAFVAVLATTSLLSPFIVLVGTTGASFGGLLTFGVAFSGFLAPVQLLPLALQVPARLLPASWAMDAIWLTLNGAPAGQIAARWGYALAEAIVFLGCTGLAYRSVEGRVRQRGGLSPALAPIGRWGAPGWFQRLPQAVSNFLLQAVFNYRAVFAWVQWPSYVSNVVLRPAMQVVLFYMLGQSMRNAQAAQYTLVGMLAYNSPLMVAGAISLTLISDRGMGTLPYFFASSGSRLMSYFSRGFIHIFNGLICSTIGLAMVALLERRYVANVNWLPAAIAIVLATLSSMMFALVLGDFVLVIREWSVVYTSSQALLLALTGVVLPLAWLPSQIRWLAQILPTTHAVAGLRQAFSGAN